MTGGNISTLEGKALTHTVGLLYVAIVYLIVATGHDKIAWRCSISFHVVTNLLDASLQLLATLFDLFKDR